MPEPTRGRRPTGAATSRARILEVAREVLEVNGGASLNSIARKAGVGSATLYRHFPNRESLVFAVYRAEVRRLVGRAPELLREEQALRAFRRWFERLAGYVTIKRVLGEALTAASYGAVTSPVYDDVVGAVALFLRAGEEDGSIRPGLDPDDVLLLMGSVWRVQPGPAGTSRAARLLDLVVESLRAR